jgi:hypothetical protein
MRITLLIASAAFALNPALVHADVVVSTSLSLTDLQIQPASGSVQFISPWTASVFAQAQDSLGGLDAHSDSVVDSATATSAATSLANATGAASFTSMNGTATSGVNIPNIAASASSVGQGQLSGVFEIVGTTGTVSVQFSAPLVIDQSLTTSVEGLSASSEVVLNVSSPDINSGNPLLFFDNPITIGPNASKAFNASPTLTDTETLVAGQKYLVTVGVDAESSGLSALPETSFFPDLACGLCALLLARRLISA